MSQVAWVAGNSQDAVGSIAKPTGTWDCLVLVLWCYGQDAAQPTTMTGWTLVRDTTVTNGVGIRQRTFVRPGASGAAPSSFAITTSSYTDARIDGFLDVDQTTPVPDSTENSGITGTTATGLSVNGVADSLLYLASAGYNAQSTSTPTGMTPREVNFDGSSNNVWTQAVGAGATGNRTFTLSTNDVWACHMILLQPVGSAGFQTANSQFFAAASG